MNEIVTEKNKQAIILDILLLLCISIGAIAYINNELENYGDNKLYFGKGLTMISKSSSEEIITTICHTTLYNETQ